MSTSIS